MGLRREIDVLSFLQQGFSKKRKLSAKTRVSVRQS